MGINSPGNGVKKLSGWRRNCLTERINNILATVPTVALTLTQFGDWYSSNTPGCYLACSEVVPEHRASPTEQCCCLATCAQVPERTREADWMIPCRRWRHAQLQHLRQAGFSRWQRRCRPKHHQSQTFYRVMVTITRRINQNAAHVQACSPTMQVENLQLGPEKWRRHV